MALPAINSNKGPADPNSSVLHRSLNIGMPMAVRGEGNYLYTANGEKILDGSGGAAVVSVGHGVPEIIKAVADQLGTLPYVSSALFGLKPAEELAQLLCRDSGMARALFLTGGSEAVESAIKVSARAWRTADGTSSAGSIMSRTSSRSGQSLSRARFRITATLLEVSCAPPAVTDASPRAREA